MISKLKQWADALRQWIKVAKQWVEAVKSGGVTDRQWVNFFLFASGILMVSNWFVGELNGFYHFSFSLWLGVAILLAAIEKNKN